MAKPRGDRTHAELADASNPSFCAGSCTTNGNMPAHPAGTRPPTMRQNLAARRRPRSREHETAMAGHEGAVAFACWLGAFSL
jgi:hypothetical protein